MWHLVDPRQRAEVSTEQEQVEVLRQNGHSERVCGAGWMHLSDAF